MQMTKPDRFSADLLERSASGYAGYAAALMFERDPAMEEREGSGAPAAWRSHLTQRVLDLAAALSAGEPKLFTGRVQWSRKAFRAQSRDDADIRRSIQALRDVLAERLPKPALDAPLACLDAALEVLAAPAEAPDATELDPQRPTDRLALEYLQKILEGNAAEAVSLVSRAVSDGLSPQALYMQVLLPAQREVGRLWHAGELSVAEEHMVTAVTQRAMAVVISQAVPAPANGRTAVVAAVSGNVHDIGLRALADMYQLAGWRVIYAGSDVPMLDLPALLSFYLADLLMLGATLATHIPRIEQAIASIRERCERPVRILVGGAAFDDAPEVWSRIGSDGYAAGIDEALAFGEQLVGS
jgi:methanogenic corrinoid protein MtbC1